MYARLRSLAPQPLTGILMSALALLAVAAAIAPIGPSAVAQMGIAHLFTAVWLLAAVVVADHYPIHIHYHTKICLTTVPLYLMAVLLPLPLAALTAGLSTLGSELLVQTKRGSLPSDIATSTGRWVLVVLVAASAAQYLPDAGPLQVAMLLAIAVLLFLGDVVTGAFELAPMVGAPRRQVMLETVRHAGMVELVQYALGVLGAMAAPLHWLALVVLAAPSMVVYRICKERSELHGGTRRLLESMADAVDLRDPYTGGHSRRVTEYCTGILRELGLEGPDVDLIVTAARVHDIGKIGTPDEVLKKPGALTAEERAIIEQHPVHGVELLARHPDFSRGVAMVRHHHERWDGQGYPDRLAGHAIPFGARVIAVADSFDAMTSDRPYRPGMAPERAEQILRDGRAMQWDAQIVNAFLRSRGVSIGTVDAHPPELNLQPASTAQRAVAI